MYKIMIGYWICIKQKYKNVKKVLQYEEGDDSI